MSSFFAALSGGLTRFIYAWLMPAAVVVVVFGLLVLPYASPNRLSLSAKGTSTTEVVLVFVLSVMVLSVLFAYTSLPLYRFLEGYTMPRRLKQPLLRRRYREWYRAREPLERYLDGDDGQQLDLEQVARYPTSADDLLPTKLGNALRGMEYYGDATFGLDSQTLWHELQAVANDNLRRDTEDARAGVDFFISALAHLIMLAVASGVVAVMSRRVPPALVAAGALGLAPLAYVQAVRNVANWRSSVQALVHLGRLPLARALGFAMPPTFSAEREMWQMFAGVVHFGPREGYLKALDRRRTH